MGIFSNLSWQEVILALVFLGIIRPISGLLGLWGSKTSNYHKLLIAIFGIRGIGTFYYLAYIVNHASSLTNMAKSYGVLARSILISIILHGMSSSIIFQRISKTTE